MTRHAEQTVTLGQLINEIESSQQTSPWHDVIGLEIPGLYDALERAHRSTRDDAFDEPNRIEREYISAHASDTYRVWWPEHVTAPRINGDATYYLEVKSE